MDGRLSLVVCGSACTWDTPSMANTTDHYVRWKTISTPWSDREMTPCSSTSVRLCSSKQLEGALPGHVNSGLN